MGTALFLGLEGAGKSECAEKVLYPALGTDMVAGTGLSAWGISTKIGEIMEPEMDDVLEIDPEE